MLGTHELGPAAGGGARTHAKVAAPIGAARRRRLAARYPYVECESGASAGRWPRAARAALIFGGAAALWGVLALAAMALLP